MDPKGLEEEPNGAEGVVEGFVKVALDENGPEVLMLNFKRRLFVKCLEDFNKKRLSDT